MKKLITAVIKFTAWGVPVAILAVFAFMLIRNTWPQKVKDSVITINVVEAKGKTTGDEVQISKSALKDSLQQSAYAARREAQNEYDRNFSTLLTILTIFGIAWPLIVAFAQYKFNEKQLDKIQHAETAAQDSVTKANEALENANNAIAATNKLTTDIKEAYIKSLRNTQILYGTFELAFVAMSADRDLDYINYCFTLGLLCRSWSIQLSKEIKLDSTTVDCMIKRLDQIKPEAKISKSSQYCRDTLAEIKNDLLRYIDTDDPKVSSLVEKLYVLLDEKIAAYDKLLATAEEKKKEEK